MGSANSHQLNKAGEGRAILILGIDLAKNVIALHRVNEAGKPELLRPGVPRSTVTEVVASLPPGFGEWRCDLMFLGFLDS